MADVKDHIFNFEWRIVMKALWDKYPNKIFEFVKYDNVIDFRVQDNIIYIKKVKFCSKFKYIWAYFVEDIKYDIACNLLNSLIT